MANHPKSNVHNGKMQWTYTYYFVQLALDYVLSPERLKEMYNLSWLVCMNMVALVAIVVW
jgi:hypothetical protein